MPLSLRLYLFHSSIWKKTKTTKQNHPVPCPPKTNDLRGGKPYLPLCWVENCEMSWRIGNEDNMTCCFPDLWVHAFSLTWLCLRCKTHANRPVLFTKLISVSRKPWVCSPGGAGRGSCSSLPVVQGSRTRGLWPLQASSGKCRSSHQFQTAEVHHRQN